MIQRPFADRLGTWFGRCRHLISRLSRLLAPIWDEGLRLALWWGLMMVSAICILELCRWFWLIYPETVIGKRYMASAQDFPAFAHLVLQQPHWYPALFLVTVPCVASLALAWVSHFFYIQRLLYNPFGSILRSFIWAAPVAGWTGYYVTAYLELTLQTAIICAAGPSLVLVPQAFRTANRLCPELLDGVRWLRRGLRQLRYGSAHSKRLNAERLQREGAHFF